MPNPVINPDGTVQVAPPTQSAFAMQPGQPAPPPQQVPQVQSQASGFDGLIQALVGAIRSALPQGITQRKAAVDEEVARASGEQGAPAPSGTALGNQFHPR